MKKLLFLMFVSCLMVGGKSEASFRGVLYIVAKQMLPCTQLTGNDFESCISMHDSEAAKNACFNALKNFESPTGCNIKLAATTKSYKEESQEDLKAKVIDATLAKLHEKYGVVFSNVKICFNSRSNSVCNQNMESMLKSYV